MAKTKEEITGYELSRDWFDWCFENPDLVTPNHTALYFFCIEHWNRMGKADKFGLPMEVAKSAIGIKNYRTYSKTFEDIVSWGFIKMIQKSKNQYSANVVAIVKNTKANAKALSKAMQKHIQKHSQKQRMGIVGINKPLNLEPITLEPLKEKIKVRDNVTLFDNEIEMLQRDYSEEEIYWMYEKLSAYKLSKDKEYKSDYGAICVWVKASLEKYKRENKSNGKPTFNEHLQAASEAREQSDEMLKNYAKSKEK